MRTWLRAALLAVLLGSLVLGCGRLSSNSSRGVTATSGPPPPPPDEALPEATLLVSAVADAGRLRVDWSNPTGATLAVFLCTDEAALFDGPPAVGDPEGTTALIAPLSPDTTFFVGLGRATAAPPAEGPAWEPVGPVLVARTGAPIFVDAGADPDLADGTSPETAFPLLAQGTLTAFIQGGGNVWVAGGTYEPAASLVFPGTHVLGGFGPGFLLEERDPEATPSVLLGPAGQSTLTLQGGVEPVVLDGLVLDGRSVGVAGVAANMVPLRMRGLTVRASGNRGVRLFGPTTDDPVPANAIACAFVGNGSAGLALDGAVELAAYGCRFDGNVQEGLDLEDLVGPAGRTVTTHLSACRFASNGAEGADLDLAAPPSGGANGARFEVRIEDCRFETNGLSGLLIDIEYEAWPQWSAEIVVRRCLARANRGSGFALDIDSAATVLLHGVVATGNGADGILLTSESFAAEASVVASALVGNLGAGLRAGRPKTAPEPSSPGNVTPLLAHSIVAGNGAGGMLSEFVLGAASSSVAWLQPDPWLGVTSDACVTWDDATIPVFERAPSAYGVVVAVQDDKLTVSLDEDLVAPGDILEVASDGVVRRATSVVDERVVVDPPAADLPTPSLFARFPPGRDVDEDYQLAVGSPAEGAGLSPPGGLPVDAGIFGAATGAAPGPMLQPPAPLFWMGTVEPALAQGLPQQDPLRIDFLGGSPAPGAVNAASVRAITASGTVLATSAFVLDDRIVVAPPRSGWGSGLVRLELHAELAAEDGTPLASSLILPLTILPP